jgi:hypothetical protein
MANKVGAVNAPPTIMAIRETASLRLNIEFYLDKKQI